MAGNTERSLIQARIDTGKKVAYNGEDANRSQRRFWAVDSEFLMSGKAGAPEDVHTVQIGFDDKVWVLQSADELKAWLKNHWRIKVLYGFVILPDLGSLEEWLGEDAVKVYRRGSQHVGSVKYGSFKARVFDVQPLLQSFGIRKLEECGEIVGISKMQKPDWLGLRSPQNEVEREYFFEYAKVDCVITSRIARWLWENFQADAQFHASAGTLARDVFQLPKD